MVLMVLHFIFKFYSNRKEQLAPVAAHNNEIFPSSPVLHASSLWAQTLRALLASEIRSKGCR